MSGLGYREPLSQPDSFSIQIRQIRGLQPHMPTNLSRNLSQIVVGNTYSTALMYDVQSLKEIILKQKDYPPWRLQRTVSAGGGRTLHLDITGLNGSYPITSVGVPASGDYGLSGELNYGGIVAHVNERVTGDSLISPSGVFSQEDEGILCALQYCFEHSFVPTDLSLDCFLIDSNGWVQLDVAECLQRSDYAKSIGTLSGEQKFASGPNLIKDASLLTTRNSEDLHNRPLWEVTLAWVEGRVSNYDYLLILNHFAGRRMNDPGFHPVFPWICDFSLPEGGWRDLSKTKYRLSKGDQQLDQSYLNALGSAQQQMPHHVPEILRNPFIILHHSLNEGRSLQPI